MSDHPATQDVVPGSAIPEGYVRVRIRDVRLDVYNDLNQGARPAVDEGLTARMATLNLERFSGETGKDVFGWLTSATARLRVTRIPTEFWVNAASSAFTGAANAWFTSWAAETVGDLHWDAFRNALEGQYQGGNPVITRASPCLFVQQTGTVQDYLQKWRDTLCNAPPAVLTGNALLLAAIINGLRPQYCRWVDQGACTTIEECFRQIQLVESRVGMGFKRQPEGQIPKGGSTSNGA